MKRSCNWANCKLPVTHRVSNKWSGEVWFACDKHVPEGRTGNWKSKWYSVSRWKRAK